MDQQVDMGPLPTESKRSQAVARAREKYAEMIYEIANEYELTSAELMSIILGEGEAFMKTLVASERRAGCGEEKSRPRG